MYWNLCQQPISQSPGVGLQHCNAESTPSAPKVLCKSFYNLSIRNACSHGDISRSS